MYNKLHSVNVPIRKYLNVVNKIGVKIMFKKTKKCKVWNFHSFTSIFEHNFYIDHLQRYDINSVVIYNIY